MTAIEYGVMHADGDVEAVTWNHLLGDTPERAARRIARAWDGQVVTRVVTHSLWTDEPSACPRCDLPVWPSGLGALHADGSTDCLLREGVPT